MIRLMAVCGFTLTAPAAWAQPTGDPDLASRAKEVLRSRCSECHFPPSGGKKPKANLAILDHPKLLADKEIVPGKPDDSELYRRISSTDDGNRMPPTPAAPLAAAEIEIVRKWIVEDARPFPPDAAVPTEEAKEEAFARVKGADYVHRQMLAHVEGLPERDLPYIRYFSINHLLTTGISTSRLEVYRDALAKAVNHLSTEPEIAPLMTVDAPTNSIFAIDLRKIGWTKKPFVRWQHGQAAGVSEVNLWDLVLLEYPYGVAYTESELFSKLYSRYMKPAGLIRPVPFIRIDWFVSTATQPPLYEDVLGLPRTTAEFQALLKLDPERNLEEQKAFRAGMVESGVSRNNRVVERHPLGSQGGYYWQSFDFQSSKGAENMFADPINLKPAGGEFIFTLPNRLQGYYVAAAKGTRLDFAPTTIVTDAFASDKTVRNGLACMRCHDKGMKRFADTVRPALEKLPGQPGFDRRRALELYAPQKEWDDMLGRDTAQFLAAMKTVLGKEQTIEPLAPVSKEYLDYSIGLAQAAGELGLVDANDLKGVFRLPQFSSLGLASLASDGRVKRDTWEEYHATAVRLLGLGVPVVPVDGVTRPDILVNGPSGHLALSTNRAGNVFAAGDKAIIKVKNLAKTDLYIEMIGTGPDGRMVVLVPAGLQLKPGETYQFAPNGGITVRAAPGRDTVTVFASEAPFPPGELLRGDRYVSDRFVHPSYTLEQRKGRVELRQPAYELAKKTLEIETK